MLRIERKVLLCVALVVMAVSACAVAAPASVTIASFADPSSNSGQPLFTINYETGKINGMWDGLDLTLDVAITGATYSNAVFKMDELVMPTGAGQGGGYYADSGILATASYIRFYDDVIGGNEVLTIEFNKVWVNSRDSGLDAQDAFMDGVKISGIGFGEIVLENERFGFSFANNLTEGKAFNATASFTSSGAVPEPATLAILALGGLMLRRRK